MVLFSIWPVLQAAEVYLKVPQTKLFLFPKHVRLLLLGYPSFLILKSLSRFSLKHRHLFLKQRPKSA